MAQFDDLVGELTPGQVGWLSLDSNGYPTGEPATVEPPDPGPDVYAASVMRNPNDPVPDGQAALLTSTGADLDPPLTSSIEKRGPDWQPPISPEPEPPVISHLAPNTAVCGTTDFELTVIGSGFTPNSVIVFNGGDEPTDYFDSDTIRTGVKPSLVSAPISVPVAVRNADVHSNSIPFEFTAPAGELEGRQNPRFDNDESLRDKDQPPRRK